MTANRPSVTFNGASSRGKGAKFEFDTTALNLLTNVRELLCEHLSYFSYYRWYPRSRRRNRRMHPRVSPFGVQRTSKKSAIDWRRSWVIKRSFLKRWDTTRAIPCTSCCEARRQIRNFMRPSRIYKLACAEQLLS